MRDEIRDNPEFGVLHVTFEHPGEQIIAESGAMVARDTAIDMKTSLQGGLASALKRRLTAGESLFQNTFTATAPMQSMRLAPAPEGSIERIILRSGMEAFLQSGAYLASTPGITLDTKWQGARGFFAGGLSLLRAYGEGLIWFSSYGGIHTIDVGREHQGYICDNTHLLAFTEGLRYQVRKLAGLKGLFLSGEGLVCEFQGHGRLWLQTRNPGSLSAFLHPFRPVGGGH
ncbi:MAG TPA: TIGR00266 family protein [Sorangium sp.]|uniref:TIGR00266 family protein n=1 Tax=Sorangium sp. So ce1153 TaxID=3133333 RepID=UPI002B9B37CD|nr:TIGR00266 family protein [Sorangium sp.]